MENVRKYYKEMARLLSRKTLTNNQVNIMSIRFADESLDGIRNKLLSMPKESIHLYAKFIVEAVNKEVSMFEYALENELDYDFLYHNLDLDYLYQRDYSEYFPYSIIDLFKNFGIKIEKRIYNYEDYHYNFEGLILLDNKAQSNEIKNDAVPSPTIVPNIVPPKSTFAQRWIIIRSLMECAVDWRLTDDENRLLHNKKDIADFMSFLAGGSSDRNRKCLENDIDPKAVNEIIPYLEKIGLQKIATIIRNSIK